MRQLAHPLGRRVTRALLCLLLAAGLAVPAAADETVRVPDVKGRDAQQAIDALEKAGLSVRVIEVAGPKVDVVDSQDPLGGVAMRRGGIVTIRIGIKARVETIMPNVAGKRVEDALELLAAAYDVMIVPVDASGGQIGRVTRTEPRAGAKVWFRAPVTIYVAEKLEGTQPRTEPPSVPAVPAVPALPSPRSYPPVPEPPRGWGPMADLRPPGAPAAVPGPVVAGRMPRLVGLSYEDAQRVLLAQKLIPHPWFFRTDGTPWQVYTQKVAAGRSVSPGTIAHFRVILPRTQPTQVPAPHVVGLELGAAIRIARDLGLRIRVRGPGDVTEPGKKVTSQSPAANVALAAGATFEIVVGGTASAAPTTPPPTAVPPTQAPAGPLVPTVVGMTAAQARTLLARAGLTAEVSSRAAPEAAPGRVFEQMPPAGLPAEGKVVHVILPAADGAAIDPKQLYAKVPDVVNRSPASAEAAVNATGLRAVIERGPEVAGTPSVIIAQSHHPGALIKMGTPVTLVTGAPEGAVGTVVAPPKKKDDPNAIEKVERFFRKKHKKAWGKIKDIFK